MEAYRESCLLFTYPKLSYWLIDIWVRLHDAGKGEEKEIWFWSAPYSWDSLHILWWGRSIFHSPLGGGKAVTVWFTLAPLAPTLYDNMSSRMTCLSEQNSLEYINLLRIRWNNQKATSVYKCWKALTIDLYHRQSQPWVGYMIIARTWTVRACTRLISELALDMHESVSPNWP